MFVTVDQFLQRVHVKTVRELLDLAQDALIDDAARATISTACDDSTAELEGKLSQIPAGRRPSDATLLIHGVKVATYLLSLGSPAKETEQIRNAYTDTMKFYDDIIAASSPSGGTSDGATGTACAPPRIFTCDALKGFGGRGI